MQAIFVEKYVSNMLVTLYNLCTKKFEINFESCVKIFFCGEKLLESLFDRHALRQIPRLVDVVAHSDGGVICQQLYRD